MDTDHLLVSGDENYPDISITQYGTGASGVGTIMIKLKHEEDTIIKFQAGDLIADGKIASVILKRDVCPQQAIEISGDEIFSAAILLLKTFIEIRRGDWKQKTQE